jgi:hypothetical protein
VAIGDTMRFGGFLWQAPDDRWGGV